MTSPDSVQVVVVELLGIILGDKSAGVPGFMRRVIDGVPHLKDCRIGQWVDGYSGDAGAPCSAFCIQVREACGRALDYLGAPAVPHLETRPAESPRPGRAARRGISPMSRRARAAAGKVLPPVPARRASREAV